MLNIKNLRKSFTNSNNETFNVINIPEFILEDSELLAISGDSGSGKSTLLKTIGGELKAGTGSIRWKGLPLDQHPLQELARERAFLDQQSRVPFAFTAREIVRMGRYQFYTNVPSPADEQAVDCALRACMPMDSSTAACQR